MGLTYSYTFIARRADAERLVRALGRHLDRTCRLRLKTELAHGVEGVTDRAAAGGDPWEANLPAPRAACLTFLFPADNEVAAFVAEGTEHVVPVEGRLPVGCVWTDLVCGEAYVRLQATAATSGMSSLFARNPGVRSTFGNAGREGRALLVLLDEDLNTEFEAIWPYTGRLSVPPEVQDAAYEFPVDRYSAALLAEAERTFGPPPTEAPR